MTMKTKMLVLSIITSVFLVGCNTQMVTSQIKNVEEETQSIEEPVENEIPENNYEFVDYKNGVKITKYVGIYNSFIKIPQKLKGKRVIAIGAGAFKRKSRSRAVEENTEDPSAYYIDDNVEEIEQGAFEEDSTFVTPLEDIGAGWEDSAMTGSAQEEDGNVYFDTDIDDVTINQDTLYTYDEKVGGYYIARCLTRLEEVNIPTTFDGKYVIRIGAQAFYQNPYIKIVNISQHISDIYQTAFKECSNLREINFDSPNLAKIKNEAFCSCPSLETIILPENCTVLSSKSFSLCGEIAEVHIPSTMTNMATDTFSNTTVKKIVYYGTEEQWNTLISLHGRLFEMYEGIQDAIIDFIGAGENYYLDSSLDIFRKLKNGSSVIAKGIMAGYAEVTPYTPYNGDGIATRANYLLLIDKETGYTIVCYNPEQKFICDMDMVGREIVASGTKSSYYGAIELSNVTVEYTDNEEKYEIPLAHTDWTDENINFEEKLYYYDELIGTISYIDGNVVRFEEISSFYAFGPTRIVVENGTASGSRQNFANPGDKVRIKGILFKYNTIYEFIYDCNEAEIITE